MAKEQTIKDSIELEDTAVHTGKKSRIRMVPAEAGSGIRFHRVDLPHKPIIPAIVDFVSEKDSYRRTTICSSDGAKIFTIEHLLSALYAIGIDNLLIEINCEEVPFVDGSSLPFAEQILAAGILSQEKEKDYLVIDQPIIYRESDDVSVSGLPYPGFAITFFIDYADPVVGKQALHLEITPENYINSVSGARTYLFSKDFEELRSLGLARGGNENMAVVITEKGYLNDSLRFPDEMVRHKILDIIGDLSLVGKPLKGHIMGKKSGHRPHLHFVKKMKEIFAYGTK